MPFEIPISWESTGLDWSAADPLWPLEKLNLCCIEAIKECDAITGRTVPALLSAAYNPIRPNRDYVNAIHSEVTALISLFANHTDSGGNWDGQNTIPTWTEATILTAIGDGARIAPSILDVLSPWYFQTKKILCLLKWALHTRSSSQAVWTSSEKSVSGSSWADAKSDFAAASWAVPTVYPEIYYLFYNPVTYYITCRVGLFNYTRSHSLQCSIDLYQYSTLTIAGVWEPYSTIDQQDKYNLIYSDSEGGDRVNVIPISTATADALIAALGTPTSQDHQNSGNTQSSKAVLKFDGVNGRKFI